MSDVLDRINKAGLVPVVVIENANNAIPAAEALMSGGLDVMEITMRTAEGIESIRRVKKMFPKMLVGAGTVLSVEKAAEVVEAGAEFIVSPGFNEDLVKWCLSKNLPITPGCVTPTEIDMALKYGLHVLKFFPANVYGGINGLSALAAPYNMVSFIPTGGINAANLVDFADKPFVHAIGGGWLCEKTDISEGRFEKITKTVKEAISILLGFDLAHIGINAESEADAESVAETFSKAFNFAKKTGASSIFAGTGIEVNKSIGLGTMGHIAIKTNNIERACNYLEKQGFAMDPATAKQKNGKTIAVYLKDEFGSFAVHLLQK